LLEQLAIHADFVEKQVYPSLAQTHVPAAAPPARFFISFLDSFLPGKEAFCCFFIVLFLNVKEKNHFLQQVKAAHCCIPLGYGQI
jgi:hypothetical protein